MKQENDVFEFETEALGIRNNDDYVQLVQCLNLFTGFREQALKDLDQVLKIQTEALSDPHTFVEKLRNGENLGIPDRLTLPEIPKIDWEKYKLHPFDDVRPVTRPKQRETMTAEVVHSRPKVKSKPASYNQPWTPEEQKRLEELLIEYPPSQCEARRFQQIAKALGNRTLSQVTSRCQKYFQKLHQAGLPVPGRCPPRTRVRESVNKKRFVYSTFFPRPAHTLGIIDDLPGTTPVATSSIKVEIDSDDSDENKSTSDRKLALLRRVRSDLMKQTDHTITHAGFMCNVCKDDPLKGTRWHCSICPDMDVCSWCLIEQLESDTHQHPIDHPLVAFRPIPIQMPLGADKDYPQPVDNYLDTNFQPD